MAPGFGFFTATLVNRAGLERVNGAHAAHACRRDWRSDQIFFGNTSEDGDSTYAWSEFSVPESAKEFVERLANSAPQPATIALRYKQEAERLMNLPEEERIYNPAYLAMNKAVAANMQGNIGLFDADHPIHDPRHPLHNSFDALMEV